MNILKEWYTKWIYVKTCTPVIFTFCEEELVRYFCGVGISLSKKAFTYITKIACIWITTYENLMNKLKELYTRSIYVKTCTRVIFTFCEDELVRYFCGVGTSLSKKALTYITEITCLISFRQICYALLIAGKATYLHIVPKSTRHGIQGWHVKKLCYVYGEGRPSQWLSKISKMRNLRSFHQSRGNFHKVWFRLNKKSIPSNEKVEYKRIHRGTTEKEEQNMILFSV